MPTRQHYTDYFSNFSLERYERYAGAIEEMVGHRYRFCTTPYFLPRERYQRLIRITESVLKLLRTPAYQERLMSTPWFLPQHPMGKHDFFGDVEFHIGEEDEKFIEVNIGQPGHIGFLEILEGKFLDTFAIPGTERTNDRFEELLVDAVTDGGRYRKIAVAVNHTAASTRYYAHYKYFEKIFARYGVEAKVVYAHEVRLDDDGYPAWEGVRYERIFTLLIPKVWGDNPEIFAEYTRAYERHPELFIVNPLAWKAASKELLALCYNLPNENFGLADEDVANIRQGCLETYRLGDFSSAEEIVERFGDERNIVLKALDNYHGKGLFLRPTIEQLRETLSAAPDSYVVQRFYAPGTIPCISRDGSVNRYLFSLRMCFINGEFYGMRGYNFTIPSSQEDITPVVVV